ncbi:MAG TPA: DUF2254 domain-containing protein, partial [Chthoniobacteraceae bacterium]
GLGVTGAQAMYSAIISLTLAFIVFTFGSLLVAIQVASGQYSPRVIATTLLRDDVIRYSVGLFVFTFLFAIKAANRTDSSVRQLVAVITGLLGFASIVGFLFLIDYAARMLRPVSLVRRVGEIGLSVIKSVYPTPVNGAESSLAEEQLPAAAGRPMANRDASGVLLAVHVDNLAAAAERLNGVIELVPQVGDFVGRDEPLFLLHGGAADLDEDVLLENVVFGSERTMEQDPLFAFRILVDIAIKALSKAINDPTTAVLAIDQLQRLLRTVGRQNLRADYVFNRAGSLRLILRTPNWEDFVHLAFTEIRFYGAENIQIARRLRAMIHNLADTLPEERSAALRRELELLDRTAEKLYVFPEDLALARIPDTQGFGAGGRIEMPALRP